MDSRLTRRNFLIGAAGAVGVLGAAACSKGPIHVAGPDPTANLNLSVTSGAADGPSDQALSVFEAGIDQRVAFLLAGKSGFLAPAPGAATLKVSSDEKHWGPPVPLDVHSDTGASASTYITSTYRFATPGLYWLRASYQGLTADTPVVVIDRSVAKVPYAGQKLISVATPTTTDSRGVNPICTRNPICPFHSLSLDVAMTQHLPIALVFATPALCTSATCGPVLDSVVAASAAFAGKINFVHSEIYVSLSRNVANTPAVLAYNLQSEPLMFLADANGTIVERIDGLFGRGEAIAALTRLAAV